MKHLITISIYVIPQKWNFHKSHLYFQNGPSVKSLWAFGPFLFGNAFLRYCWMKPHEQNEMGNKKGNFREERLHDVVVTEQLPHCRGSSELGFISQSCQAFWDLWELLSSWWSLSNEKCLHRVDPLSQWVTSAVIVAEVEGARGRVNH